MHSPLPVLLALVGSTLCVSAQSVTNVSGGPLLAEQAAFDVRHYDLTLRVDPEAKSIEGSLGMRAAVLAEMDEVVLHLDDRLRIFGALVGAEEAAFQHADGLVRVPLGRTAKPGETFEVSLVYGGKPRVAPRPPWDGGFTWKKTPGGEPWIATSCQGEGADLWWPCKDHPSDKPETMDLRITVPEGLVCASNGTLQSVVTEAGETTYHWKIANPISNYNVALNIAPYVLLEKDYESVTGEHFPVKFWVLPSSVEQATEALPHFIDHLRFYEEVCGPYPFRNEKYGIVQTPHLGMEHQTIIAYGNGFKLDDDGYDWLHHHELGHEWWANLVTCSDWKDMWVHEGICTYMQALYLERTRGPEAYSAAIEGHRRGLSNRMAVAPKEVHDTKQIYFNLSGNDIYYKGAVIMHSLRWALGDETFFAALRRMAYPDPAKEAVTDGSQVWFADTEAIEAIAEKVAGQELDWFFDVYLYQEKLPRIQQVHRDEDSLTVRWVVPEGLTFPMPLEVKIDGVDRRIEMPNGEATIEVPSDAMVALDPNRRVLRK